MVKNIVYFYLFRKKCILNCLFPHAKFCLLLQKNYYIMQFSAFFKCIKNNNKWDIGSELNGLIWINISLFVHQSNDFWANNEAKNAKNRICHCHSSLETKVDSYSFLNEGIMLCFRFWLSLLLTGKLCFIKFTEFWLLILNSIN